MAELISLHGDGYLCNRRYRQLVEQAGTRDVLTMGGQEDPAQAMEAGRMMAFMEPRRIIRIDGAMTPPEGTKRATSKRASQWAQNIGAMADMPDTTMYVWLDGPVPKSDATQKEILKHGTVESLPAPEKADLGRWISSEIESNGGEAEERACRELAERCGNDLWRLSQECAKVALYAGDRRADASDVALLVEPNTSETIFNAVDVLCDGRPGRCAETIEGLLDQGQRPYYVLTMLQREARNMLTVQAMDQEKAATGDILRALGTKSDFVLRKTRDHLRQAGRGGADRWYEALSDADMAIKTGALDEEEAIYWLIGRLAA